MNDNFLEGTGTGGKSKLFCTLWHDLSSRSLGFATVTQGGLTSDFSASMYVIVREVQ
jgi:hypothetical protein